MNFSIVLIIHIGRKAFGTIALNDEYSIESVSMMFGHTIIKTTQAHYAVVLSKKDCRKALNCFYLLIKKCFQQV